VLLRIILSKQLFLFIKEHTYFIKK